MVGSRYFSYPSQPYYFNHISTTRLSDRQSLIANIRNHGINFIDIPVILDRDIVTVKDDRHSYGEQRLITFGLLQERVIAFVHTKCEDCTHIISVRKATKHEQRAYFEQLSN